MTNNPTTLVQKLCNHFSILRDDCLSFGDYVEPLTFLLFLKMAHEPSRPAFHKPSRIVAEVERRLSVVEELEATVSASLQRAARLWQAILQKATSKHLKGPLNNLKKHLVVIRRKNMLSLKHAHEFLI